MSKTKTLTSPFAIADKREAYAAYCAMPVFKRADRTPMTKREFNKIHKTRHAEIVAASDNVVAAKDEQPAGLAHLIAQALADASPELAARLLGNEALDGDGPDENDSTDRAQRETDAARNAVLWRLNVEGLLHVAYERAEALDLDYITQEIGTAVLTENFGPLPARK